MPAEPCCEGAPTDCPAAPVVEIGAIVRCGTCGAILSWTLAEFIETPAEQRELHRALQAGHHLENGVPYHDGMVTGCRCPKAKVA